MKIKKGPGIAHLKTYERSYLTVVFKNLSGTDDVTSTGYVMGTVAYKL